MIEGEADQVGEPAAQGGGEAQGLAHGKGFGRGEGAFEFIGQQGEAAQAGAAHRAGVGVKRVDGSVDGGEEAKIAGAGGDAAFFPGERSARMSFSSTMVVRASCRVAGVRRVAAMVVMAGLRAARLRTAVRRRKPEIRP